MRWIKAMALSLIIIFAAMLSGCSTLPDLVFSPQELYSLPELPAKYTELNLLLNEILGGGAEYAAPTSGTNIQPVQLVDLDGDGRQEAVAFFRNAAEEKPLKICIFTANGDNYTQTGLIEASGTSIYSMAYNDLDGDGQLELLIGWKAAAELQVLEVYTQRHTGLEVLLSTDYVKYTVEDLDLDQRQEVVVFHSDEEGVGIADYYDWQADGGLSKHSSARISATMAELSQQGQVSCGVLADAVPAVFVTGISDMAMTDILTVQTGQFSNIALSELTGMSGAVTRFSGLYPIDIDGDGVTEVPCSVSLPVLTESVTPPQRIDWLRYDSSGVAEVVLQTYHDMENGWYLRLPEEWSDCLYVNRSSGTNESYVTFSVWDNDLDVQPFLRITSISGSNRDMRATRGGRFLLSRQAERLYTAELLEASETWEYAITADEVRAAFGLIAAEWTAGDN